MVYLKVGRGTGGGKETEEVYGGGEQDRGGGEGFHVPRFNRDTEMRNLWR